ncbi:uncharacterized protein N7446_010671 [Penicillium canescens]|uniref:Uncharacterized protein n=1 Tax=Penicillium canescens TaxID=5083 RepID=A0AAD6IB92_PENCN|nr:uncharacterized protein N7446_010671 [Penicillium canescens]KAJ6041439.1 hypothetical protein N7460_006829 [Penicillium canescens]KAJ6050562.1 hypothetical protein N7446_010671 [Penicillium canescens]
MAGSSSSGSGSGLVSSDPTVREAVCMGSGHGAAKTTNINTRSKQAFNQRTSSANGKAAKPAVSQANKVSKPASKPASVATGGNATSIATRNDGSQPTETSVMTPNNTQTLEIADDFLMDISEDLSRPVRPHPAGIHQSIHAPIIFRASRSEPVKTRSKRSVIPSIVDFIGTDPNHKDELSWNPPLSSALAEKSSNGWVARKATKSALGKENWPILNARS